MGFERICLLGVGLLGGSVALACRKNLSHLQIVGYSPRADELTVAAQRRAIDVAAVDPVAAVSGADLVILCTPVGVFGRILQEIAPALKHGATVTDVGSTKRAVVQLAGERLPSTVSFVGSHPMAGGEKHGIEHAREDLLSGALCILTPTPATNPQALDLVEQFWQSLKMRTTRLTPAVHDQLTSDVSHLPHVIASALVRIQSPESLELAARGFLDATRIAAGDPGLWTDILLENRENLQAGIERIQSQLAFLQEHLDAGDADKIRQWLAVAVQTRVELGKNLK